MTRRSSLARELVAGLAPRFSSPHSPPAVAASRGPRNIAIMPGMVVLSGLGDGMVNVHKVMRVMLMHGVSLLPASDKLNRTNRKMTANDSSTAK